MYIIRPFDIKSDNFGNKWKFFEKVLKNSFFKFLFLKDRLI